MSELPDSQSEGDEVTMPIHWSVWSIKPGKKGFAKRYPPGSYQAADVLKVALMNAHRDDPNVYFYVIKERTPLAPH